MEDRLRRAFLEGYVQAMGGDGAQSSVRTATLVRAAAIESRHLRSSVDACEEAIAQLGSLPPAENAQLKVEVRASLETLGDTVERLMLQLQACLPIGDGDGGPSAGEGSEGRPRTGTSTAVSSASEASSGKRAAQKSSSKKGSAKKSQSKKRRGK